MTIGFDAKRYFHNFTGLGNYSRTLIDGLRRFAPELDLRLYDSKGLERSLRLGHLAAADGCTLFHGLSNELPLDVKASGIRSVVTVHDTCWRTFPGMYHIPDILIHDIKCRTSLRNADAVVAISESTRNDIVRLYGTSPSKISVIYQSVDPGYFEPVDPDAVRADLSARFPQIASEFLLSVGSLNARKNTLAILEALAAIAPAQRPQLVVCGGWNSSYGRQCRAFAASHLADSDVVWLGGVDTHILRLLYPCALALVYPSHYEGFGLPVAEALLQHTPVVTSRTSSLPEAAGPGALFVDPRSVDELSCAISRLVQSPSLRHSLATLGHDYCLSRFNPQRPVREYLNLYHALASGK